MSADVLQVVADGICTAVGDFGVMNPDDVLAFGGQLPVVGDEDQLPVFGGKELFPDEFGIAGIQHGGGLIGDQCIRAGG